VPAVAAAYLPRRGAAGEGRLVQGLKRIYLPVCPRGDRPAAREVLAIVEALGGHEVGLLNEEDRRFPIAIRLEDRYRLDAEAVGRILVIGASGDQVPLGLLVRIREIEGPTTIQRDWAKRRIVGPRARP
jgi:hypothetical protein